MIGKTNAVKQGGGIDENTIYIGKYQMRLENAFMSAYNAMRNAEVSLVIADDAVIWNFQNAFRTAQPKSITIHGSTASVTNFNSAFKENGGYFKEINGDGLDLTSATNVGGIFDYSDGLETVIFVPNTIGISISFAGLSKLNDTTLASIVAGLKDMTGATSPTLTLHSTPKAKLTAEQIATITAKNWTLA